MLSDCFLSIDTFWGLLAETGSIRNCSGHGSPLLATVKRERETFRRVVFHLDCLNNPSFFLRKGQSCSRARQPYCWESALPAALGGVPSAVSLLSSEGHPYILQPGEQPLGLAMGLNQGILHLPSFHLQPSIHPYSFLLRYK